MTSVFDIVQNIEQIWRNAGYSFPHIVSKSSLTRGLKIWLVGWLNGVLRHFQQYFSHIMATVHIIHVFPGFHQY